MKIKKLLLIFVLLSVFMLLPLTSEAQAYKKLFAPGLESYLGGLILQKPAYFEIAGISARHVAEPIILDALAATSLGFKGALLSYDNSMLGSNWMNFKVLGRDDAASIKVDDIADISLTLRVGVSVGNIREHRFIDQNWDLWDVNPGDTFAKMVKEGMQNDGPIGAAYMLSYGIRVYLGFANWAVSKNINEKAGYNTYEAVLMTIGTLIEGLKSEKFAGAKLVKFEGKTDAARFRGLLEEFEEDQTLSLVQYILTGVDVPVIIPDELSQGLLKTLESIDYLVAQAWHVIKSDKAAKKKYEQSIHTFAQEVCMLLTQLGRSEYADLKGADAVKVVENIYKQVLGKNKSPKVHDVGKTVKDIGRHINNVF